MTIQAFQLNLPKFTERLKMMTSNTLDLLRQETTRLIKLQISTLQEALPTDKNATENPEFKTWISNLENERQKIEKLEMVLAVIGTMKAGKSTTINAIVGMEILPNRETAMTTLPTLIRNIHGQKQPILKIEKIQPLLELSKAIAQKLNGLSDVEKNQIDLQGIEDGKTLITQLIQQHGYPFKTEYNGQEAIFEFLKHLNDIMRLAKDKIIDIEPPYAAYENVDDLPVIEVEFCHLKDNQDVAQGSLAILDTPGPNEFGQSPALRKVFRTQLEKASAVLLVTDFTQMKTEADQNVRDQIADIEDQLPKGSLYVVVNKFDQRNKNSMTKDEVKDYVANSLMAGKVEIAQVFPVSSYFAYLANRVKSYLEQHDTLPSHEQELWLGDFAEKAFGAGWEDEDEEENIWDVDHVKDHIKKLEKKSLFDEPIEKVIKEAHATAANKSLDSAIKKLTHYNNESLNRFRLYSATITNDIKKDIEKIKEMRQQLEGNIQSCGQVKDKITEITNNSLSELEKEMDGVIEIQKNDISKTIERFFKDGKGIEDAIKETIKIIRDKKLEEVDSGKTYATKFFITPNDFEYYKNDKKKHIEDEYKKQLKKLDPTSQKIKCNNKESAEGYTKEIIKGIADIFYKVDEELNRITKSLIEKTTRSVSEQIDITVNETLKKAEERLAKSSGVNLSFNLPPIDLKITNIDVSVLFTFGYNEKSYTVIASRYKDNFWGEFCEFFNADEWGKEEYEETKTDYIVDLKKIKDEVTHQLKEQIKEVSNKTKQYLKDDFERPIDEHLIGLVNYLKEYLNVLNSAKESSKLDEAAKTELIKHLASLLRKQEILKGDIDALNEAIKNSVLLQPLKEQFQKQIDTLSKRQETLKSDIENAINKSV